MIAYVPDSMLKADFRRAAMDIAGSVGAEETASHG
jgi:hypothetical protein